MILVDTVVWLDFLDRGNERLERLLGSARSSSIHLLPARSQWAIFAIDRGPCACSQTFPQRPSRDDEILSFVERRRLFGRGIGYIDAHLVVATQLTVDARLLTYDKRLAALADELGLFAGQ